MLREPKGCAVLCPVWERPAMGVEERFGRVPGVAGKPKNIRSRNLQQSCHKYDCNCHVL